MPMSMKRNPTRPVHGFTLIELIVSVGLFSIVIVIAMSAYLSLISLDRKARAVNDVMTNLSFVTENMSRSIRTGTNYDCGGTGAPVPTDCSSGANSFSFTDEDGQTDTYLLSNGTIKTCLNANACTGSSATVLTDSRVNITNLMFYTRGATNATLQPNVIFTMTGSITPDTQSAPIPFTIEGGATQRVLDL